MRASQFFLATLKEAPQEAELPSHKLMLKKVYDDYSAFRRDANLWFRFTEATFDNFMQSQRL